jgi:hypothetical protein
MGANLQIARPALLPLLAAAALLLRPAAPLAADPLSEAVSGSPSFAATLNGSNQALSSSALSLKVADNRGGGDGWNLTITSTQFVSGLRTLPPSTLSVSGVTSTCTAPACTNPTNAIAYPLAIPAGLVAPPAVKLFDAAKHTGLGTFAITPTLGMNLPANAYAGNYSATVIFSIVNGP